MRKLSHKMIKWWAYGYIPDNCQYLALLMPLNLTCHLASYSLIVGNLEFFSNYTQLHFKFWYQNKDFSNIQSHI